MEGVGSSKQLTEKKQVKLVRLVELVLLVVDHLFSIVSTQFNPQNVQETGLMVKGSGGRIHH